MFKKYWKILFLLFSLSSIPSISLAATKCSCTDDSKTYWDYVLCTEKATKEYITINRKTLAQCTKNKKNIVVKEIDSSGGEMILPDYAKIKFPKGVFKEKSIVIMEITKDKETDENYKEMMTIFNSPARLPYEVRIISDHLPVGTIEVSLNIPPQLLKNKQLDVGIAVPLWAENDMETHDIFEIIKSTFDKKSGTISASVPDYVFTDSRHPKIVEAAFVIIH